MSEQRLNIELFKAIREKIATAPDAYDQESYGRPEDDAPCGTAACIAGWACVLSDRVPLLTLQNQRYLPMLNVPLLAAEALALTADEAATLFTSSPGYDDTEDPFTKPWPEPYAGEWAESIDLGGAEQVKELARIAVAYLDWIIENGRVL